MSTNRFEVFFSIEDFYAADPRLYARHSRSNFSDQPDVATDCRHSRSRRARQVCCEGARAAFAYATASTPVLTEPPCGAVTLFYFPIIRHYYSAFRRAGCLLPY
jgi:hypothetical protein